MYCNGTRHHISISERPVVGMIVVKELFQDEYLEYSKFAFDLSKKTGTKCFIIDMMELDQLTFHRRTEEGFFAALRDVFLFAHRHGQFPRSRFGLVE